MSDYLKQRERERALEKIRGKAKGASKAKGNGDAPPQLALDFAQAEAVEADAELVLSYEWDAGVLVCGATRAWKDAIKATAVGGRKFRFSRRLPGDCAWYVPNTRNKDVERASLEQTAEALRRAGATVDVQYTARDQGERRTFAEREAERAERAAERVERSESRAERLKRKADEQFAGASMSEESTGIPFGQPILVGHHSEGKHRRAVEKAQRKGFQALETSREAERAGWRAKGTARRAEQRTDPGTMARRVERLQAELRKVQRNLKDSTGEHKSRLEHMEADLAEQISYWGQQIDEAVSAGATYNWSATDFKPGDGVDGRHGWAVVQRVNPKSLSVRYTSSALRGLSLGTLPYDRIDGKLGADDQRVLDAIGDAGEASLDELPELLGVDKAVAEGVAVRLTKMGLLNAPDVAAGTWKKGERMRLVRAHWQGKKPKKKAPKKPSKYKWKKTGGDGYQLADVKVRHKGIGPFSGREEEIAHTVEIVRLRGWPTDEPWGLRLVRVGMLDKGVQIGRHRYRKLGDVKADAEGMLDQGKLEVWKR